jgi:hypothetical protein
MEALYFVSLVVASVITKIFEIFLQVEFSPSPFLLATHLPGGSVNRPLVTGSNYPGQPHWWAPSLIYLRWLRSGDSHAFFEKRLRW